MTSRPSDPSRHMEASGHVERTLAAYLPVDELGVLVNAIVQRGESDPTSTRVDELADAFGLSERHLQRLTRDRLGLTGLLPPGIQTLDDQVARVLENCRRKPSDLERYIRSNDFAILRGAILVLSIGTTDSKAYVTSESLNGLISSIPV